MISSQLLSPVQRLVMGLFFSVFLAMGCGFFYFMALKPFFESAAARQWVETPCRIVSSEVKSHSDSDGTTYSVEIAYVYKVDGREQRSNRYQFLRLSSSGRPAKAKVVAQFPRGRQTVCYVNPKNSSEAVLDRSFASAGLFTLLPLVFVGIGVMGVTGAVRGKGFLAGRVNGSNEGMNAGESWRQRPDWASGRIVSTGRKGMAFACFFAVIWNAISFPIAWKMIAAHEIRKGNEIAAIVLLFPLVGMGLLFWALQMTLRWVRFGESVFEMAFVPGLLGGALEGVVRPSRPIHPEGSVQLRLNCFSRTTRSDGEGTSTQETLLWQHETAVEMSPDGSIPVAFHLPADGCETTVIGSGNGILWRLEVKARVPGVDYAAQFEVPVFKGELPVEQQTEAAKLLAREQAEIVTYVQPATSRIRVGMSLRGGTEFVFPAARNPGSALVLTALAALFSGMVWLAIARHGPLPVRCFLGFFDLILTFAAVYAWTHSTRVEVTPDEVAVTQGVLGISRRRTLPGASITAVKTKISGGSGSTVWHYLSIVGSDGKETSAGSGIADAREAEWLAGEMMKALKRPQTLRR